MHSMIISLGRDDMTDVEPVVSRRYSSQRQLRLDLGLLVAFRLGEDLENCPKDFDQTWSEVRGG